MVHLLRGDVLRGVLRRAVLRARAVGAVARRRRSRRADQLSSCGRTSRRRGRPTAPATSAAQFETMAPWGIPLLNTLLLLSSGVTITIAHHALRAGNRKPLLIFLALTVILGFDVPRLPGARIHRGLHAAEPHARQRRLRLDVLHADRLPRPARDARRDHADGDLDPLREGPLHARITTSRSKRWPGTGTSSTWCGSGFSCSCTCSDERATTTRSVIPAKAGTQRLAVSRRKGTGSRLSPGRR